MARKKKATQQEVEIASLLVPLFTSHDLLTYQPVVHQILKNSFNTQKVNHAYLLTGSDNTQLLQIAMLIAQSLVCEKPSPLACGVCDTCVRVSKNLYTDGVILNSYPTSIKKDEILQMQSDLANTALEMAAKKFAIIHHIEHSSLEASNALLKFIEEPQSSSLTIVLTTTDENSVLPTIRSRTQMIRCLPSVHQIQREDFESIKDTDDLSWFAYEACAPTTLDMQRLLEKESFPASIETFKKTLELFKMKQPFMVNGQKQVFNLKDPNSRMIVMDTFTIMNRFFKKVAAQEQPFPIKISPSQGLNGLVLTQQCQQNLAYNANLTLCVDHWLIEMERILKEESV
jgi:hypothetical protein